MAAFGLLVLVVTLPKLLLPFGSKELGGAIPSESSEYNTTTSGNFGSGDEGRETDGTRDALPKAGNIGSGTAIVTKVLDGDTVIVSAGDHVRLLGIDADEKGYSCYDAGRLRLEELVLGKTVLLERDSEDLDQYGRQLRYLFLNGENINQKMVAEGLAIARFYPQNQKYKNEIVEAEVVAIKNKVGCKWKGK